MVGWLDGEVVVKVVWKLLIEVGVRVGLVLVVGKISEWKKVVGLVVSSRMEW